MKPCYVIDTSVVLYDPQCIYKFGPGTVVIPMTVLEEVDHFKKDLTETGRNARHFSRLLDELRKGASLSKGVTLKTNITLIVDFFESSEDLLPSELSHNKADHKILSVAMKLLSDKYSNQVTLISKDVNLRVKAQAVGIESCDFDPSPVDIDELFRGIVDLPVPPNVLEQVQEVESFPISDSSLYPNAYVRLINQKDPTKEVLTRYRNGNESVVQRVEEKGNIWGIQHRNSEQACALDALLDKDIKLVTLVGKAGTGKTLLAIACGLKTTIDDGEYQKLLVSRPIFPLGKDIGFLPGEIEEKLNPWMQPIFDNIDYLVSFGGDEYHRGGHRSKPKKAWEELIRQGMLQIEPLTYIRGRSLAYQYLIVDEAQNLTPHEMKTIITRAGEGTKVILTGDCYQIDNPYIDATNNGLTYVVERFKNEKIAAHITLTQGERSQLAELATNLL